MANQTHLIVLVHGLWGNVHHLDALHEALTSHLSSIPANDAIQHIVHKCSSNQGNFTYDGIVLGGERLANEIRTLQNEYANSNTPVTMLSIVGYSLGGLISRYAIGCLYKDFEAGLRLVNFTTFGSPHVGIRFIPELERSVSRFYSGALNFIAPRILSATGAQLFLHDSNDYISKEPLLLLMSQKSSIFYKALAKAEHLSLYSNIIGDRCSWFTAAISHTDPYALLYTVPRTTEHDPRSEVALSIPSVKGYDPVIIDPSAPVRLVHNVRGRRRTGSLEEVKAAGSRVGHWFKSLLLILVFAPVFSIFLIAMLKIKSIFSRNRLTKFKESNISILTEEEYIWVEDQIQGTLDIVEGTPHVDIDNIETVAEDDNRVPPLKLSLSPEQHKIIDNLNSLPWKKYGCHITATDRNHRAMIMREKGIRTYEEGKLCIQHWVDHFATE
ncbi:hypothetical protein CANCADRAFT_147281 [Tortispora caseinolytica NRRL Y-17796]|uniref:DUF676 domain-containing protein n=1 Tax=Tortispora caseinolytica NRRL Y-17796 TaxID=767744 RepID=A0A1E4TII1_9ASCO|nr:hypothetical protein CANCADRAFT_147281 [Tortispora caseinolytica NRRL Y-17796]